MQRIDINIIKILMEGNSENFKKAYPLEKEREIKLEELEGLKTDDNRLYFLDYYKKINRTTTLNLLELAINLYFDYTIYGDKNTPQGIARLSILKEIVADCKENALQDDAFVLWEIYDEDNLYHPLVAAGLANDLEAMKTLAKFSISKDNKDSESSVLYQIIYQAVFFEAKCQDFILEIIKKNEIQSFTLEALANKIFLKHLKEEALNLSSYYPAPRAAFRSMIKACVFYLKIGLNIDVIQKQVKDSSLAKEFFTSLKIPIDALTEKDSYFGDEMSPEDLINKNINIILMTALEYFKFPKIVLEEDVYMANFIRDGHISIIDKKPEKLASIIEKKPEKLSEKVESTTDIVEACERLLSLHKQYLDTNKNQISPTIYQKSLFVFYKESLSLESRKESYTPSTNIFKKG
jgi:hypothetical protein